MSTANLEKVVDLGIKQWLREFRARGVTISDYLAEHLLSYKCHAQRDKLAMDVFHGIREWETANPANETLEHHVAAYLANLGYDVGPDADPGKYSRGLVL